MIFPLDCTLFRTKTSYTSFSKKCRTRIYRNERLVARWRDAFLTNYANSFFCGSDGRDLRTGGEKREGPKTTRRALRKIKKDVHVCREPPSERRADRRTPFREDHTRKSPPPLSLRSRTHPLRSSLSPDASEASPAGASEVVSPDAKRRGLGSAAAERLRPPRRRDPIPESQAGRQAARRG